MNHFIRYFICIVVVVSTAHISAHKIKIKNNTNLSLVATVASAAPKETTYNFKESTIAANTTQDIEAASGRCISAVMFHVEISGDRYSGKYVPQTQTPPTQTTTSASAAAATTTTPAVAGAGASTQNTPCRDYEITVSLDLSKASSEALSIQEGIH